MLVRSATWAICVAIGNFLPTSPSGRGPVDARRRPRASAARSQRARTCSVGRPRPLPAALGPREARPAPGLVVDVSPQVLHEPRHLPAGDGLLSVHLVAGV